MGTRCFLAIELPPEVQKHLGMIIAALGRDLPPQTVSWVKTDGAHLTLHFLGNLVADEVVEHVARAGSQITGRVNAFALETDTIGTFPPGRPPTVIYLRCRGAGETALRQLRQNFGRLLIEAGVPLDLRPWHPHLTLGRIRQPVALPRSWPAFPQVPFNVNSVCFLKSTLTPDGPIYERISQFELQRKPLPK